MNDIDIELDSRLTQFGETVTEYLEGKDIVESLLQAKEDPEELRIRMTKVALSRRKIRAMLTSMNKLLRSASDNSVREQAIALFSFLNTIGLREELEVIQQMRKSGLLFNSNELDSYEREINLMIKQISSILDEVEKNI
ncbi:hypothetical protein HS7_09110 [Sulfolobales archaeon HS-7]|nr:hypothetical protein HS7_09110 [Sulfolobales archaeon HS-7]